MMFKDYYLILGVSPNANLKEIKDAYRKLVLQYHPDINKSSDAADKFILLTEAYEVLRDTKKREEFDKIYSHYTNEEQQKKYADFDEGAFKQKNESWHEDGKTKSEEYSSISYEEFVRRLTKEMSVGLSYIPNMIAIILTISFAIGTLLNSLSFLSLMFTLGLFFISYRLFVVAKDDYIEDRKIKTTRKS